MRDLSANGPDVKQQSPNSFALAAGALHFHRYLGLHSISFGMANTLRGKLVAAEELEALALSDLRMEAIGFSPLTGENLMLTKQSLICLCTS